MDKIHFMKTFILLSAFVVSSSLYSADTIYGSCGPRPGVLEAFFSQAKKIREKCINDIYEAEKLKTQKELEELYTTNKVLNEELKKVAYKTTYNTVLCHPPKNEPRNPLREKKCSEIVQTQNNIVARINTLMGWDSKPKLKAEENIGVEKIAAPCPSQAELNQMQSVRYYNKKLYQTWERCVTLAQ